MQNYSCMCCAAQHLQGLIHTVTSRREPCRGNPDDIIEDRGENEAGQAGVANDGLRYRDNFVNVHFVHC